jgi:carbon monoxide dehydrogenase subunit G
MMAESTVCHLPSAICHGTPFPVLGNIPHHAESSAAVLRRFVVFLSIFNDSGGMGLASRMGMNQRKPFPVAVLPVVLSILGAAVLSAHTAISVDVARGADDAYVVDASFDVDVPQHIAWQVLTDYEGIGRFVSSIRQSTVRRREAERLILEQYGVGKAWIVSLPMHVVLDVREDDQRSVTFRDLCGKSFSTYEGKWELTATADGTRVTYQLKADPNGKQPSVLARSAIRGSVKKLLDEVRTEILARAAR